ncbi:MAG TPA: hypothetical protein VNC50_06925, partial [Planctomycetia bacterium]|nr:hypothetical protein [Planctomycetia bacterium]
MLIHGRMFVPIIALALGCVAEPPTTKAKSPPPPERVPAAPATPGGGIWSDPVSGELVAALERPIHIDFVRLPLRAAIVEIAAKAGIQFDVEIDAANVDKSAVVSVSSNGRTLRLALEAALAPLNCTVMPRGGLMLVIDRESERKSNVIVVYPVPDICLSGTDKVISDLRPILSRAIRETVDRDVWDDPGGGDATVQLDPCGLALIVSAPFQTQLRLGATLDSIRRSRRETRALLKREGMPSLEELLAMQSAPIKLLEAVGMAEVSPLLAPAAVASAAEAAQRQSEESRRMAERALRLALQLQEQLDQLRAAKSPASDGG